MREHLNAALFSAGRSAIRELLSASKNRSATIVREASLIIRESCGAKLGWQDRG